jgi:hypothetical protein
VKLKANTTGAEITRSALVQCGRCRQRKQKALKGVPREGKLVKKKHNESYSHVVKQ